MKGKVMGKQIESVLKKYISKLVRALVDDYVTCMNCKNVTTTLYKNPRTRVYEMRCLSCQSTRSVQIIKAGFHAYGRGERRKEHLKQ
jgi:translation initiation factor 2 beta subunit (eIF-2beta)/eIF-5